MDKEIEVQEKLKYVIVPMPMRLGWGVYWPNCGMGGRNQQTRRSRLSRDSNYPGC